MSDKNQNKEEEKKQLEKCKCTLTCCDLNALYYKNSEKLKQRTEDVVKLQQQIQDLYNNRSIFEQKTKQQIIIDSANALISVFNILSNILKNNQVKDIVDIKDSAMFNACNISLKQIYSVFNKISVFIIEPEVGEKYDPNFHNGISTVSKENIGNQAIAYMVEPGFYYKKENNPHVLIKAANK